MKKFRQSKGKINALLIIKYIIERMNQTNNININFDINQFCDEICDEIISGSESGYKNVQRTIEIGKRLFQNDDDQDNEKNDKKPSESPENCVKLRRSLENSSDLSSSIETPSRRHRNRKHVIRRNNKDKDELRVEDIINNVKIVDYEQIRDDHVVFMTKYFCDLIEKKDFAKLIDITYELYE